MKTIFDKWMSILIYDIADRLEIDYSDAEGVCMSRFSAIEELYFLGTPICDIVDIIVKGE